MLFPIYLETSFTSPTQGQEVVVGDIIEYNLTITNRGEQRGLITIDDILPEGLRIISAEFRVNDGEYRETTWLGEHRMGSIGTVNFGPNDVLVLRAEAEVYRITRDTLEARRIENSITITVRDIGIVTTNNVTHLLGTDGGNQPGGNEPGGDQTVDPNRTFNISGTAWLDSNRDGIMDQNSSRLSGINVRIKSNGEFLPQTARTNVQGRYEFTDLTPGTYVVVFDIDNDNFRVTADGQGDDEALNSNAIEIREDGNTIIRTDDIVITNSNIIDINIGLLERETFALELNKYISNVTVTNSSGTRNIPFNSQTGKFARVELPARAIEGTLAVITYNIVVTNEGQIPGYVNAILDHLPPGLTFNSEMNIGWHQTQEGNLINRELAGDTIMPGQSRTLTLVVTQTVSQANMGRTVSNMAEIYEYHNEFAYVNSKGNSSSEALIFIGVATGGTMLYVSIVIVCMLILGTGMYFINKKVLKAGRGDA